MIYAEVLEEVIKLSGEFFLLLVLAFECYDKIKTIIKK